MSRIEEGTQFFHLILLVSEKMMLESTWFTLYKASFSFYSWNKDFKLVVLYFYSTLFTHFRRITNFIQSRLNRQFSNSISSKTKSLEKKLFSLKKKKQLVENQIDPILIINLAKQRYDLCTLAGIIRRHFQLHRESGMRNILSRIETKRLVSQGKLQNSSEAWGAA